MGFNFGKIGNVITAVMNTDKMDIGRRMEIINPDGSTGQTEPTDPFIIDVPCHIAFNKADNPNATARDVNPVIVSLTVHCDLNVDIENGDFVYAHKCNNDGNVLQTYMGQVGFPTVSQARKSVQMAMGLNV